MLPDAERSPFSGLSLTLSKSKLTAFEQCPKKLWLLVHRPEKAEFDEATLVRFAAGHRVGELARLTEPDGVLVDTGKNLEAALTATSDLLALVPAKPIFEAALIREDVIVRADILKPVDGSGIDWDLIEVKNTRQTRDWHILDVATQAWVAQESIRIRSVMICHPAGSRRENHSRARFSFTRQDVTARSRQHERTRSAAARSARLMLRDAEPAIKIGPQCEFPYACQFRAYCARNSGVASAGDGLQLLSPSSLGRDVRAPSYTRRLPSPAKRSSRA